MEIITRADCDTILSKCFHGENYEFLQLQVDSLKDKVPGMMAEYYLIIIKAKFQGETVEKRFFCKRMVQFHKVQEKMCKDQYAYEKEDYVYNYLLKNTQKITGNGLIFAPEFYLGIPDCLFVLENLIDSGYKPKLITHDMAHLKSTLKMIAQFHAMTPILENAQFKLTQKPCSLYDENPLVYTDTLFRNENGYLGQDWNDNCCQTIAKIIDLTPNSEQLKKKLYATVQKTYEIVKPSKTYRNVCCHGDLSDNNILFSYKPDGTIDSCKLIDFQAIRYNPPAHDVMSYIYLTTNAQYRKQHLNELLEFYYESFYEELHKYGLNFESFGNFRESCEYVMPHIIIQTVFYATMIPCKYYPHIEQDQQLYKKFVYEDRSVECLEVYQNGGRFKDIVDEMLLELSQL